MNLSVFGAGGWGTALSILLHHNKYKVVLWEYNPEYANTLREYRENFYFLPNIKIPKQIKITNNIEEAVSYSDILVIATPTQYIRKNLSDLRKFNIKGKIFLSVSKGIEDNTLFTVSELLKDMLNDLKLKIAVLSGPSHAEEVSKGIPTSVVCASENLKIAKIIQKIFSNKYFRVYTSDDVRGTELGGALKNVIAIASGIADGAKFGDNTKAAIMTRGMNEIMRLGVKMGAKMETFFGLSGIGDLIVTCSSKLSRNRFVGEQIGLGKNLKTVVKEMKMVAEGINTTIAAYKLAKKFKIDLPIINEVYQVLFNNKSPYEAAKVLMSRPLKKEHYI